MTAARVQYIEIGTERAVIVPMETWELIVERFEVLDDERLFDEATLDDSEECIEHDELLRRLGLSPLRYLRQRKGLTQEQLAHRCGLSQGFIARVESGRKRLSEPSRRRVARALGVAEEALDC